VHYAWIDYVILFNKINIMDYALNVYEINRTNIYCLKFLWMMHNSKAWDIFTSNYVLTSNDLDPKIFIKERLKVFNT